MLVGSCVGCSGEGEGLSGIGCVHREVGAIGRLVSNWFVKSSVECMVERKDQV